MLVLRTCSARRYRIHGRLPSPYDESFHARLTDRRFLPLAPLEEHGFGWVSADNLLVTRFDVDTVVRGETALLGLRIDKRRPDPKLARARLALEVDARRKAAEDAGHAFRLGRDERQQLKADVHSELLKETQPRVEVHTVVVHPKRRLLWMLGLGRTANETLLRLVRDTFGVQLTPLTPFRRAEEILAGRPEAERLEGLGRSEFAPPVLDRTAARATEVLR
jgi:DNA recombination-dependent growth factor C